MGYGSTLFNLQRPTAVQRSPVQRRRSVHVPRDAAAALVAPGEVVIAA
jgi:hypothetical protein